MNTKLLRAVVAGVALLLGSATAARAAADYCLDVGEGGDGDLLVLKAFTIPAPGKCVDARGFYKASNFAGGAACRSSADTRLTVVLTATGGGRRVDLIDLALPAHAGTFSGCLLDSGSGPGCFSTAVARIPCPAQTVPVP
jgi:hypothetical protein